VGFAKLEHSFCVLSETDPLNMRMKNLSVLGFNTGRWAKEWGVGIQQLRDWILEVFANTCKHGIRIKLFKTLNRNFTKLFSGEN